MTEDANNTTNNTWSVHAAPNGPRFIAGYGCYVNVEAIIQIDVHRSGLNYRVAAYLADPSPVATAQAAVAYLTGDFTSEADAFRACNKIAEEVFGVTTAAEWPEPRS